MSRAARSVRRLELRIPDNPLGPVLRRYLDHLVRHGYGTESVSDSLRVVDHLGRWLGRRPLNASVIQRFVRRHLPVCHCPPPAPRDFRRNYMALHRLLKMIRPAVEVRRSGFPDGFRGRLLRRYQERLVSVRGLAAGTVRNRLRSALTMLTRLRVRQATQLAAWTPKRIEDFVACEVRRHEPGTANAITSATRSFLRFLLQEGLIRRDLSTAVPKFACWKLASLPETLREDELDRLLNMPDAETPIGMRDRAMLLCMSELGLRAGEVARLELGGVDLDCGKLRVHRSKRGGPATFPIPRKLSQALNAYLRHGRPTCTAPTFFVSHWPPGIGKPICTVTISVMVKRWVARAGLPKDVGAAHVLRHSVASRMLCAGASLRQIADVLGHRSIDTTTIYAKVDLKALSRVGLPWPGAKEVQR